MAERWYRDGATRRDAGPLRRVVDQAFCSSWGDDALELLGDLAFQDGRFGEALAAYGQLVADRPDDPFVAGPSRPSVDLRGWRPRRCCAGAAREQPPEPADDLAEFARRFPGPTGRLAGRTGGYASILAEAIAGDRLEIPGQPDGRWPTFAGSPRRTRVVPGPIDVGQVQWRVDLEKVSTAKTDVGRDPRRHAGPASRRGPRACWPSTRSCWATRCWSATGRRCWPITSATGRRLRGGRGAAGDPGLAARSRRRRRPAGGPAPWLDPALHAHGAGAPDLSRGWA